MDQDEEAHFHCVDDYKRLEALEQVSGVVAVFLDLFLVLVHHFDGRILKGFGEPVEYKNRASLRPNRHFRTNYQRSP